MLELPESPTDEAVTVVRSYLQARKAVRGGIAAMARESGIGERTLGKLIDHEERTPHADTWQLLRVWWPRRIGADATGAGADSRGLAGHAHIGGVRVSGSLDSPPGRVAEPPARYRDTGELRGRIIEVEALMSYALERQRLLRESLVHDQVDDTTAEMIKAVTQAATPTVVPGARKGRKRTGTAGQ